MNGSHPGGKKGAMFLPPTRQFPAVGFGAALEQDPWLGLEWEALTCFHYHLSPPQLPVSLRLNPGVLALCRDYLGIHPDIAGGPDLWEQ